MTAHSSPPSTHIAELALALARAVIQACGANALPPIADRALALAEEVLRTQASPSAIPTLAQVSLPPGPVAPALEAVARPVGFMLPPSTGGKDAPLDFEDGHLGRACLLAVRHAADDPDRRQIAAMIGEVRGASKADLARFEGRVSSALGRMKDQGFLTPVADPVTKSVRWQLTDLGLAQLGKPWPSQTKTGPKPKRRRAGG